MWNAPFGGKGFHVGFDTAGDGHDLDIIDGRESCHMRLCLRPLSYHTDLHVRVTDACFACLTFEYRDGPYLDTLAYPLRARHPRLVDSAVHAETVRPGRTWIE